MDRPGLKLNVALKSRLGESPSVLPPVKRLKQADGPVGQGISSLINLNYPMSQEEEIADHTLIYFNRDKGYTIIVTYDALYLEQNDRNTGFMPGAVAAKISPNDPEVQPISESELQKWIDLDWN